MCSSSSSSGGYEPSHIQTHTKQAEWPRAYSTQLVYIYNLFRLDNAQHYIIIIFASSIISVGDAKRIKFWFFILKNGRDVSGSDAARSFIFHIFSCWRTCNREKTQRPYNWQQLPDGRPLLYVAHFAIGRPITFSISCWRIKKNFVENTINK